MIFSWSFSNVYLLNFMKIWCAVQHSASLYRNIVSLPLLKSDCLICHRPIIIYPYLTAVTFLTATFFCQVKFEVCNKNPCNAFKVGGKFPEPDLSQLCFNSPYSQYMIGEIIPVINLLDITKAYKLDNAAGLL